MPQAVTTATEPIPLSTAIQVLSRRNGQPSETSSCLHREQPNLYHRYHHHLAISPTAGPASSTPESFGKDLLKPSTSARGRFCGSASLGNRRVLPTPRQSSASAGQRSTPTRRGRADELRRPPHRRELFLPMPVLHSNRTIMDPTRWFVSPAKDPGKYSFCFASSIVSHYISLCLVILCIDYGHNSLHALSIHDLILAY